MPENIDKMWHLSTLTNKQQCNPENPIENFQKCESIEPFMVQ